ncbi:Disulfide oxidoreductase [Budvicia aquatica]|uniref:Disulfide oxidoreductase n=1 Tax=Budvicia aquatica TaxID=82979 RepID=A0A484ZT69_9GAMM|nr:Disulfide oxidoreductase [Budvicia aquatica]
MLLRPCVLCIYERCALFGILAAALIGIISPSSAFVRYAAILLWIYSSIEGLLLTWKHTMIQFFPSPANTCDIFVRFPDWLPLDKWLPSVFVANGDCSEKQWSFSVTGNASVVISDFCSVFYSWSVGSDLSVCKNLRQDASSLNLHTPLYKQKGINPDAFLPFMR